APVELIVDFCEKRLRELLDAVFVDEATLRLVLREARGIDGGLDQLTAEIDKLILAALEADLRTAAAMGPVRPVDHGLGAQELLGGVEKIVMAALAVDEPVDLDRIVRAAVQIELFGILNLEVK